MTYYDFEKVQIATKLKEVSFCKSDLYKLPTHFLLLNFREHGDDPRAG